ncbi:MAG: insulinase family protein [Hyphomonadaceae bacterium]|nr:insulinase family protein [Clostridia bacterium]
MKQYTLKNGVRVVQEAVPYVRSVAFGIWLGAGSRRETAHNNGISHFIEHMLFKGTSTRTAKEIAEYMDSIGGQLNAYTGKENTCFYAKTLDNHVEKAISLLCDMLFQSTFLEENIDTERSVILEEINMYEDSPEDLAYDNMTEAVWAGDALGRPILGTEQSLANINAQTMRQYMAQYYVPKNAVISVAGNFDHTAMQALIEQYFSQWAIGADVPYEDYEPLSFQAEQIYRPKEIEQVHLCLGYEGFAYEDNRFYTLQVMNAIFGGGMSSRIFQSIREEKGLAYTIYSHAARYQKAGIFSIYGGFNPNQTEAVMVTLKKEIELFKQKGVTPEELNRAKEQIKGGYIMSLESVSTRMQYWGKSIISAGKIQSIDDVMTRIDNVNQQKVHEIAQVIFNLETFCISAVGALKNVEAMKAF